MECKMLDKEHIKKIKEELDNCKNPLFFFHDDPDGLASFLLLYKYKREGRGIVLKARPTLDTKFLRKVEEYSPDKIFILDIAEVEQDFIDNAKVPVVWIDHHGPFERDNVRYFNPRIKDKHDNTPVTLTCYQTVNDNLWIAMVGCVGDWTLPYISKEFKKKYPKLLPENIDKPEKALFETELGRLVRILSFILKGKTSDVLKCARILTRIDDPYEILKSETSRAKFIIRRYDKIKASYDELLNDAIKAKSDDGLLIFTYPSTKMSFTGDLSNELLYKFPDKLIIVGREKDDEVRMSLRIRDKLLSEILKKSLVGIEGYGGGHEHACGASVKQHDFKRFIANSRENTKDYSGNVGNAKRF